MEQKAQSSICTQAEQVSADQYAMKEPDADIAPSCRDDVDDSNGSSPIKEAIKAFGFDDDTQKAKASLVTFFSEWFAARRRAPTGPQAAKWVRDSGIVNADDELRIDIESMIELAEMALNKADPDAPDISASAFVMAAALLVVSHAVSTWPAGVLMSPQDTINFKSLRSSTFIVHNAAKGASLFRHGEVTSFENVTTANVIDVYVRDFLAVRPTAAEDKLLGVLSTVMADIAKEEKEE
nr:hypothetical protein [Pandoravirus massiliensis]